MSSQRPALALALSTLATVALGLVSACDLGSTVPGGGGLTVVPTGCTPPGGALPKTAPGGYYVNGNSLCTAQGEPHLLHGVDRPSLEWDAEGEDLSAADFALMATWHANVVRVALDQDFWLEDSPEFSAGYAPLVDQVVGWAEAAGLDVILDLHWSDQGDYAVTPGQQQMADTHSLLFWQQVAARYKGDGHVFFELYNEPHDVPQEVWLSGGPSGGTPGFTVVGMQQLHDAVRAAGADNPVIIGGLDYAYDLSFVEQYRVQGYNILYATHPYNNAPERQPDQWFSYWGYLTATSPVVVTEFGDGTGSCSRAWDQQLIPFADQRNAGWTAWAWWVGNCQFPSLLAGWNGTTTNEGSVVKAALLGYADAGAVPLRDGSSPDASDGGAADATADAGDEGGTEAGADAGDGGGDDAAADADTSG